LPAFVRRFVEAKESGQERVVLWGTGSPMREFLHTDDLASAVVLAGQKYDSVQHLNIGSGEDLTIKELAELVADLAGFKGEIAWDSSKPDGTPRKVLDIGRIKSLGWFPTIDLNNGIASTIEWYIDATAKGVSRR
jgi:GDP-L-fucose synthase